jgi:hypothetical protein
VRLALALLVGLWAGGASAQTLLEPTPEEKLIGAVDLCLRWSPADPAHVTDVVLTNSSGDEALDAKIPGMVRDIPFPRPTDDDGSWFGLNLSFGAADPHKIAPECGLLPRGPLDPPLQSPPPGQ